MKIALVYPSYWPYVRRGVERFMRDISTYMASQGHSVDIITSKPGRGRVHRDGNITTIYQRQVAHPVVMPFRPLLRFYTFGLTILPILLSRSYDVIHCWLYPMAPACLAARRLRGTPYLYHLIVTPFYWPKRLDRWLFQRVVRGADRVAVLNSRVAASLAGEYGLSADVLPPPVDMATFKPDGMKDTKRPKVLFASDLSDVAKGGILLARAFNDVVKRYPGAVLQFAGTLGRTMTDGRSDASLEETVRANLSPDARDAVQWLGVGALGRLPKLYAEAAVTVLPSAEEPFGMVLIESLASGTPVVSSMVEGPSEIVTEPSVGRLVPVRSIEDIWSWNLVPQLADAMSEAIELAHDPATADRCRAHAQRWSLETIGRRTEGIYTEMVNGSSRAKGRVRANSRIA